MDEIDTAGDGDTVVVVEVPVVGSGIIGGGGEGAYQGAVEGVDVDGGVARDVDEADLGFQLTCSLISRVTVIGIRNDVDGAHDGILIILGSIGAGGLTGEGDDVGGELEHVHGVVVVVDGFACIGGGQVVVAQILRVADIDVEVDGDIGGDVLGVVDVLGDERHVDPSHGAEEEGGGVAHGESVGLSLVDEEAVVDDHLSGAVGEVGGEEVVKAAEHADGPATGVVGRRAVGLGVVVLVVLVEAGEHLGHGVHDVDVVATAHDVVLRSDDVGADGVPHHVATVELDVAGVFTVHDVEAFAGGEVDSVAREPTHTAVGDVVGAGGVVAGAGVVGGVAVFVDGGVFTHLEAACIAFGLRVVVAHFDDGAAGPLAGVGGDDDTDAGKLGHIVEHERLVLHVVHEAALYIEIVVFVGTRLDAVEGVDGRLVEEIVERETGVVVLGGDEAVGGPGAAEDFLEGLSFVDSVDVGAFDHTTVGGLVDFGNDFVVVVVEVRLVAGVLGSIEEGVEVARSVLRTTTDPVQVGVVVVVGDGGEPLVVVVAEGHGGGEEGTVVDDTAVDGAVGDYEVGGDGIGVGDGDGEAEVEEELLVVAADDEVGSVGVDIVIERGAVDLGDDPLGGVGGAVELDVELAFLDVEGVDDADVDRTGVLFVAGVREDAGGGHGPGVVVTLDTVVEYAGGLGGLAGEAHEFGDGLFGELEDVAAITGAVVTGDIGAHAEGGLDDGAAVFSGGVVGLGDDGGDGTAVFILTSGEVGFFLAVELGGVSLAVLLEAVVSVGDADEVVFLIVDKGLVGTGSELVGGDAEDVLDAGVRALDHDAAGEEVGSGVGGVVDEGSDGEVGVDNRFAGGGVDGVEALVVLDSVVVFDVALGYETGLVFVVDIGDGGVGVDELVDLIAFELVAALAFRIGLEDGGVEVVVFFVIVVGVGVLVGEIEDDFVAHFLDNHGGGVGAVEDLEAVFEEGLADVVDFAEDSDGGPSVAARSLGEGDTDGDVVDGAGLQGEGACGLHETTVAGADVFTGGDFGPVVGVILGIGDDAVGAPVERVAIVGEHEVAVEFGSTVADGVAAVFHVLAVFPEALEVVVVVGCLGGFAVDVAGAVFVVDEAAHTEAFVVDDVVSEVDAVDGAVADGVVGFEVPSQGVVEVGVVGEADDVDGAVGVGVLGEFFREVVLHFLDIDFGVVLTIGIHVGALEEVDTDSGGDTGESAGSGAVDILTVVAVAQTTFHVATDVVIVAVTQIGVDPLAEVGVTQLVGGAVDDFVGVESHVVDLVIRGKGEGLSADFEADGLSAGLGVSVTHIVEDPPDGLVAFQHLVAEQTAGDDTHGVFHCGEGAIDFARFEFGFQGTRTEVVAEVVIGIVTFLVVVDAIAVSVEERSQVGRLVSEVTMGGPFLDYLSNSAFVVVFVLGRRIVIIVEHLHEIGDVNLIDFPMAVVPVTDLDGNIGGT